MNRIQFDRRKRKKSYLIPLVILVLLYFIIPIFLINRGSNLIEKANIKIDNKGVFAPTVEFYNGLAFLNTAAAFPGFGKWSENIRETSGEQMKKSYEFNFRKLCISLTNKDFNESEIIEVNFNNVTLPNSIIIKTGDKDSILNTEIPINDSISGYIDSVYCIPWARFFEKMKLDETGLHPICKK